MKMRLINAEKVSAVSRVYFDMYVTASNTGKRHLSGSFFLFADRPRGCGGSRVMKRVTDWGLKFQIYFFGTSSGSAR